MKIRKEITISICVILSLCILFLGIDFLKGVNVFKPSNYYTASYTNVNGLAVSAPVTINGYKIGLVSSIEYQYDNPGHVGVEFSLDKELKLPVGSKAVIVSDMLGTATVQLILTDNKEFHNGKLHYTGIGGTFSYTFTPTSLGTIGEITCTCGQTFCFRSLV